jgi:Cft2 family RNA processing exonuclease
MIDVQFLGAAQSVTGSRHLLRTSRASVLLDCGLFQGRRRETFARNRELGLDPGALDAVVLSHAHIDHSGQHTLGRRLVERRPEVRIFALLHTRRAEVVILNGFSAHADQNDLLAFAEETRRRGPLRQMILVHGEPAAQEALSAELGRRGFPQVHAPAPGERIPL